jgi:hypothetical protein
MKIQEIITENFGHEMKEKVFDYLMDMARQGGKYRDDKDRQWVQSKLDDRGNFTYQQHDVGNRQSKDTLWTCSFDDLGMVSMSKSVNGKSVLMFKRT